MRKIGLITLAFLSLMSCKKEQKTDEAARQMQSFVQNISKYAKSYNQQFLIIPQNGIQLAYIDARPENDLNYFYLGAISGFGVEEIFMNGSKFKPDTYRLNMLQELKKHQTIYVSDYVKDDSKMQQVIDSCLANGFRCYPRTSDNYYYKNIAGNPINENAVDVYDYSPKNFLYLISTDNYPTKEAYLSALKNTNHDMLLIDLFYNETPLTHQEVEELKVKQNGGKRLVVAYMNIGSAEKFRYYWKSNWKLHQPSWIKKKYPGYPDEFYVEFWNQEWQDIIFGNESSYLKKIIDAGFDGTYLDNVEAFYVLYHSR